MFREMRRKDKQRPEEDAVKIFKETNRGVLAVLGDDGYPYTVPLNHVYYNGKIYFHSAAKGHKLDAITKESKVSYCAIGSEVLDAEHVTTIYKSAVCFGKARIVEDDAERREVLVKMVETIIPDFYENGMKEIAKKMPAVVIVAIDIEHMTAKGIAK